MQSNFLKLLLIIGGLMLIYNSQPAEPLAAKAAPTPPATENITDYGDVMPTIDGPGSVKALEPSAFGDIPRETAAVNPVGPIPAMGHAPPESSVDIANHVFPVTSHDSQGCAVAIAPDRLVSVYHVVKYNRARVQVGDSWLVSEVQHPPGVDDLANDGAYLKIPGGKFPTMKIREPFYYEPVTVYGLRTKVKQRGFVSSYRTVSLLPETPGVMSGDSGGAIVGDDGCLVGLVSGVETPIQKNLPQNNRIVTFTRMDYLGKYLPQNMQATPSSAKDADIPEPQGPVDPATPKETAAVNKNQPEVSPPRYQYPYTYPVRSSRRGR